MATIEEKYAAQRVRECFDEVRTHIRMGTWRSAEGTTVRLVGNVWDLHGTVCTCCPRRDDADADR